eukprot:SAG11_NODE_8649_length_991_cov_1.134529_1_plen_99_part_10
MFTFAVATGLQSLNCFAPQVDPDVPDGALFPHYLDVTKRKLQRQQDSEVESSNPPAAEESVDAVELVGARRMPLHHAKRHQPLLYGATLICYPNPHLLS